MYMYIHVAVVEDYTLLKTTWSNETKALGLFCHLKKAPATRSHCAIIYSLATGKTWLGAFFLI